MAAVSGRFANESLGATGPERDHPDLLSSKANSSDARMKLLERRMAGEPVETASLGGRQLRQASNPAPEDRVPEGNIQMRKIRGQYRTKINENISRWCTHFLVVATRWHPTVLDARLCWTARQLPA
jgi:hypothetical protein